MQITDITKTKKGKYALFIEGEFAFSITAEQAYSEGLQIGSNIEETELEQIKHRSQRIFARERALSLLSTRAYTKHKLKEKLLAIADEEIAEEILKRMGELGLINDEDYALRQAADLYNIKKYGRRRVFHYLLQHGIEKDMANIAADAHAPFDSKEVLLELLEQKYSRLFEKVTDKEAFMKTKTKVQNALFRLGYSFDDIKAALDTFLADSDFSYEFDYY